MQWNTDTVNSVEDVHVYLHQSTIAQRSTDSSRIAPFEWKWW